MRAWSPIREYIKVAGAGERADRDVSRSGLWFQTADQFVVVNYR
jgi:hypothetical protein